MGLRFIHKNGQAIPIHTDHGDQQNPGPQHAAPANPPATPAPVQGQESTNHPEPRKTDHLKKFQFKAKTPGGQ
jgi:hypothetical protein